MTAMTDKLRQAINAIEAGDEETGQQLLAQLLEAEPKNVQAWLWLAQTVDDDDKRRQCYQRVLDILPNNTEAREALGILPKTQPLQQPEPTEIKAPPVRQPAKMPAKKEGGILWWLGWLARVIIPGLIIFCAMSGL